MRIVCALILMLMFAPHSTVEARSAEDMAQSAEDILKRAHTAYGAQAFKNLDILSFRAQYIGFNAWQNHTTQTMDANRFDAVLTIDFPNRRKDFRWLRGEKPNHSIRHWHYDGNMGYSIDHVEKTLARDASMSFASVDRRIAFLSDLAVLKLVAAPNTPVTYKGRQEWRGLAFDVMEAQPAGFQPLTLYFDRQTSLLHRLDLGATGTNQRVYNYSSHAKSGGLTYAANSYATRGGDAEMISTSISIGTGMESGEVFSLPGGYATAPETLSFREMQVQRLAEGVFLAGQDWGFSVFVNAGDFYIGVGGYHDVSKRFEAVVQNSGKAMPLRYHLVTHHHRDHLGGMQELHDLGTQFIVHPDHIASIRAQIDGQVPDNRFIDYQTIGEKLNDVFRVGYVSNAHAEHNLVAYVPEAKLLFTADMYLSRQKEGYPAGGEDFYKTVRELGFDVEALAAAHSGRVLNFSDLETAVSMPSGSRGLENYCPSDWVQCR